MIEPGALLAWSALALAVTLSPGPDTVLVASHGARGGLRTGLAAVAGIATGAAAYASLFGFGLLGVLIAVPTLFLTVKIAGALYLTWLGATMLWKAFKHSEPSPLRGGQGGDDGDVRAGTQGGGEAGLGSPFSQAFLTNILNPKVALFYLAALPQFASGPNAPLIGALLIGVHTLFGVTWLSFIAFAASRARTISWNRTFVRWLEGAIGAFFVSVAGRLALTQR